MKRTATLIPAILLLGIIACKKTNPEDRALTPREKLLGSWRRVLRASDANNNGVIDSAEIVHAPATDTFVLTLVPDATYSQTLTFKGEPFTERGTWHLQEDDREIVFQPTTSSSRVDTFAFDTLSQSYFRYRTAYPHGVRDWAAFTRPN